MKKIILLLLAASFTGCSTIKQAQTDFRNFQRTIELNTNQKAVYKYAYF